MAYSIIWSEEAENSFIDIVDYILLRWSPHEASNFILRTEKLIANISIHPYLFKEYHLDSSIRTGILHKNTTMFYKIDKDKAIIKVLLFWNSKKNPKSLNLNQ